MPSTRSAKVTKSPSAKESLKRKEVEKVPQILPETSQVHPIQVPTAVEATEKKQKTENDQEILQKDAGVVAEDEKIDTGVDGEDGDDASVYPDSDEFYCWLVEGEAGPFLASHRVKSVDEAIPACKTLVEKNIDSVYDPSQDEEDDEKDAEIQNEHVADEVDDEIEDLKEIVNFAIEDSYCVVLSDSESEAAKSFRNILSESAAAKKWLRITVARESGESCAECTISVFDALILPKLGLWKFITSVEIVSDEISDSLKLMMEKFC